MKITQKVDVYNSDLHILDSINFPYLKWNELTDPL